MEGHVGTIYQATNWIYQGNSIRPNDGWSFKFSENGEWQHGRTIFPYYKTNDPEKIREKVTETFWIKQELRKHRYVYILVGKKDKRRILNSLKYPALQYPKRNEAKEITIKKMNPL